MVNILGHQPSPALENEEPKTALAFMDLARSIPRKSHQEEQMKGFLIEWATEREYACHVDTVGNLSIKIPATPGYEKAPAVCIQNHLDMVYNPDTPEIIQTPIEFERTGDWLHSKGNTRTIGADNWAGGSIAAGVVEDPTTVHGPIELLYTVDEEDDMSGVLGFDPKEHDLQSKLFLNLDTPRRKTIAIECAGYQIVNASLPLERDAEAVLQHGNFFDISVDNLQGGHNGDYAFDNRGNAIVVLGEALNFLPTGARIVSVDGGQKNTSIPSSAKARIYVPDGDESWRQKMSAYVEGRFKDLNLIAKGRPAREFHVDAVPESETLVPALTEATHNRVLGLLQTVQEGVERLSSSVDNLPETSVSLAKLRTDAHTLSAETLVRGSHAERMQASAARLQKVYSDNGFQPVMGGAAPGWQQNPDSPLIRATEEAFKEVLGEAATLTGFHCCLEPGVLAKFFPQVVSYGPDIPDEHAITERVSLSSMRETYAVTQVLLRMIAEGKVPVETLAATTVQRNS